MRDCGLINNTIATCISKFTQESIIVEYFPSNGKPSRLCTIKETTMVKFAYPAVMIVKGCNDVLLYSITEDLYYYFKLNSPVLFESSTIINSGGIDLKCYYDLGDYLIYGSFTFSVGSSCYFSGSFYKKFLEKSQFPDQKLLAGYELTKVKFANKEEDSFVLLFSESIISFGSCTHGLVQVVESDNLAEEVIHISYDGFYFWKKGQKSIVYKAQPINFVDM